MPWTLPPHVSDPNVQKKLIDNQARTESEKTEAGVIGRLLGTKFASTNIAGVICIVSMLIIVGSLFIASDTTSVVQASTSLITLCLGYIFGSRKKE